MAAARGDVSPGEIEAYFHGVSLEGGMAYAKMFLVDSASMLSDENIKTLGRIIERYALTGKIGPVAIVATTDEAFRQARVFASAARAERPLRVFRQQLEAATWLVHMKHGELPADEASAEPIGRGDDNQRH
ncbi:MAG: hypothetical protein PSV46_02320 [Reyranella sp.]|nr:hypothetical protein [Reyranella sp.]